MTIKINPAMQEVIDRVKTAGLHEVAKREYGLAQFTLKEAAQILGTQLLHNEAKYAAVRSGLRSLREVADDLDLSKIAEESELMELLLGGTEKTAVSNKWIAEKASNGLKHRLRAQGGDQIPEYIKAYQREALAVPRASALAERALLDETVGIAGGAAKKDLTKSVPMGKKASADYTQPIGGPANLPIDLVELLDTHEQQRDEYTHWKNNGSQVDPQYPNRFQGYESDHPELLARMEEEAKRQGPDAPQWTPQSDPEWVKRISQGNTPKSVPMGKTAVSAKWIADKASRGAQHRLKAQGTSMREVARGMGEQVSNPQRQIRDKIREKLTSSHTQQLPRAEQAAGKRELLRSLKDGMKDKGGKDISKSVPMGKKASMFDLRTLKGLVPKAEQAGAKAALPAMQGAAPAAAGKGMFSQMEGTAQKGFNPRNTIRGEALTQELPAMGRLPTIASVQGK